MTGLIYCWTSPSGKRYIGKDLSGRRYYDFLNREIYTAKDSKIDRARRKYKPENFKYEILESIEEQDRIILDQKLCELEVKYIKLYDTVNTGYNICNGGQGTAGHTHICSDETRHKLSEASKGRVFTEEHKQKISESNKGNQKWLGKQHTEETKEKMRVNNAMNTSIIQYSLDGKFIAEFPSINEAARITGACASSISKVCRKERKTANGYKWTYATINKQ